MQDSISEDAMVHAKQLVRDILGASLLALGYYLALAVCICTQCKSRFPG
jgi:hypothetical protein